MVQKSFFRGLSARSSLIRYHVSQGLNEGNSHNALGEPFWAKSSSWKGLRASGSQGQQGGQCQWNGTVSGESVGDASQREWLGNIP